MKIFTMWEEDIRKDVLYIGTVEEIRSLYKLLIKKSRWFKPTFDEFPIFTPGEIYGISICLFDYYYRNNEYYFEVIGPRTIAKYYFDGDIKNDDNELGNFKIYEKKVKNFFDAENK